ncbi:MAG TPA: bifunctional indole-3-glycerol phosphate synthase/phosphoribosylanthranilate isomerase, partial [Patescibacteria group bacterium]
MEIVERKKKDLVDYVIPSKVEGSRLIDKKNGNRFLDSLSVARNDIGIVAEIKFASPTNPNLGDPKDLLERAKLYAESRVNAISLITEPHFFKGDVSLVSKVKRYVELPILQKDFVIDEEQIYQAKEIGSDALLLIARLVDEDKLKKFVLLCQKLGIEPVVEINNDEDLEKAITTSTKIVAVNARDLETFAIDIDAACDLLKKIPKQFIRLGFSGIVSKKEILRYKQAGVKGVLVGTSLMKAKNIKEFILSLRATERSASISKIASSQTPRNDESVKVKICGVRDLKIAQKSIAAGADFLGFNFVPTSKRYLDLKSAKNIISNLRIKDKKLKTKLVGIFQNTPTDEVNEITERLDLDYVQLHGSEDIEYRKKIKRKIIQKIRVDSRLHGDDSFEYGLVDREVQGKGKIVDLKIAKKLTGYFPTFIAGGLTPEN